MDYFHNFICGIGLNYRSLKGMVWKEGPHPLVLQERV